MYLRKHVSFGLYIVKRNYFYFVALCYSYRLVAKGDKLNKVIKLNQDSMT